MHINEFSLDNIVINNTTKYIIDVLIFIIGLLYLHNIIINIIIINVIVKTYQDNTLLHLIILFFDQY